MNIKQELSPDEEKFLLAYVTCALWSSVQDDDKMADAIRDDNTPEDLSDECLDTMVTDCVKFVKDNIRLISKDISGAGHDFWLTRNNHGAGFWDGDWGDTKGDRLTTASRQYPEVNLYVGDDGKIYS